MRTRVAALAETSRSSGGSFAADGVFDCCWEAGGLETDVTGVFAAGETEVLDWIWARRAP